MLQENGLLLMAVVALGRAAFFLVTVLARGTMGSCLVDGDLGRGAFVAAGAVHRLAMGFMVKGDGALFVFVSDNVCGIGQGEGEGDQHYGNNQFFHDSLLVVVSLNR